MRERLQAPLDAGRDDALLRFGLGTACLQAGDMDAAATHLAAATRHDPEYSAAWTLLGKALLALGRDGEAEAAWRAGLDAAARRGDVQSSKAMTVFLRRIARGRQVMS
ncbi:tetratricopeptide repeat protein [Luteimonas deserti]|uniref:Tetratricopeptide repeat protein n=1 Tax=Luteimonas deserti TaxID=2752306 RepID=A0A7Z0QUJ0_9GAMM|nr:tetratricopeptide repeat protein [Luteimonas deserti]NYZ64050.1 tetratricopeptide repeat protein [Luteimonas deserti]